MAAKHLGQGRHAGTGEDVFADEGSCTAGRTLAADAVHRAKAVNLEQVAYPAEISVELADTDMLHHANGNHAVEPTFERR